MKTLLANFITWVKKVFVNPWWAGCVVSAFIAVISFFQINSYAADKHHLNAMWHVFGIGFGIVAVVLCIIAYKTSAGRGG